MATTPKALGVLAGRQRYTIASLLLLFFMVDLSECFRLTSQPKRSSERMLLSRRRLSSDSNLPEDENSTEEPDLNGASKKKPGKRRRRQNCDFPSWAYSKSQFPYTSRQPVVVRFRDEDTDGERVFRTLTPRVVSVPQSEEKQEPFWKRLIISLLGPSFDVVSNTERLLPSASQTRLLNERAYARKEPFAAENMTVPPSLEDLAARPRTPFEGFWISTRARLLSFGLSYYAFPFLTSFLDRFVTMAPEDLDEITSKFAPGISILYGTFISLTLSILYNRQRDIQDNVAIECSMLTVITRNCLNLFKRDPEKAIEAGQCAADQIRTLVRSSRGAELMLLMYSDPYARLLELLDRYEEELYQKQGGTGGSTGLVSFSRDVLKDLNKFRANRLSDEALALPPTHFLILNLLTVLILLGYTISILPTVNAGASGGEPSMESSLLFAVLTTIYVLFYNFCVDLNNPFRGVYQVRRSCAASHLLEAKWLIANHPLLQGEVDFEEVEEEPAGILIRSPGLGDFWFEKDEFYVDSELQETD